MTPKTIPVTSLPKPLLLTTTWFGTGLSPYAPGTAGSLAALPFAWLITCALGPIGLFCAAVIVTGLGIVAAKAHVDRTGENDPGCIVIDEVAGQWFTLVVAPLNPIAYLIGFGLFRLFDITKPWPVRIIDQRLKGGAGIMLDDVAAAVYAAAIMAVVSWYAFDHSIFPIQP